MVNILEELNREKKLIYSELYILLIVLRFIIPKV